MAMTFLIKKFDEPSPAGDSMLSYISSQLDFGARNVGTQGHTQNQDFIKGQLVNSGLEVVEQNWQDSSGQNLKNIIGRINPQKDKRIIVSTHYDTRAKADLDKANPEGVMPGANDGASGVAVLLELAKEINSNAKYDNIGIDIVFFDGEEFEPGSFDNWKPKGSTYFADHLNDLYGTKKPNLAINIDMVCDADLRFYKDPASIDSAGESVKDIWKEGQKVSRYAFSDKISQEIKDDNTPLSGVGIPSLLLIDFSYPYFHTTKDTIDKCSPSSLETTFVAIKNFLMKQK